MDGQEKRKIYKRFVLGLMLFITAFLLLFAASGFEKFAQWYTENVYIFCVNVIGGFFGVFPFSVAECLLYLLAVYIVYCVIYTLYKCITKKRILTNLMGFFSGLFLLSGILFLLYTVFCGVNYHRSSFSEETGLVWEGATKEELEAVCERLTEEVNKAGEKVERNADGVMVLTEDVPENASRAMENLGKQYPCLEGSYPKPKGLRCSEVLSVQKLTGIYSPFTMEANYNTDMTPYNIPFTACHELAHLRGFMQEEEADFIGFLASVYSDSIEFNYSGYLLGWISCTNALYDLDEEAYERFRDKLTDKVERDLEANSNFWAAYDSPVAEAANQINDSYLKANGQRDGVESYDKMVELILTYYKKEG